MDAADSPHFSRPRTDTLPWYRQFWPWFLIAVPAAAVVMGVVTITLAVRTADGLVVDDYYKQGLAINQTLERDERARTLGMAALVRFDHDAGRIDVQLSRSGVAADEPGLNLQLLHPTIDDRDYTTRLTTNGPGSYSGEIPTLIAGKWYVMIESKVHGWRLFGRASLPAQSSLKLVAR